MEILILLMLVAGYEGFPLDGRCFSDGILVSEKLMDHGTAEVCIKDDVSMIKTTSKQIANSSTHANSVYRKILVSNYDDCNPIEIPNGPIMIFKPDKDLVLIPHTYACRADCAISLDEEEANIVLHSDRLNHFEVMGTTTANRWFQGSTSYSLEHTCEHIQVTCGSNTLSFHACFKYHMACIRLMNRSYMPAFMIQSVCQNKELILVGALILIIFGILYIMTLTYICYILIPVFYPFTYVYGLLYNKSCKKCYYCGLAYHPFSKCGKNCVCGCMFENSERMKMHREAGLCKGYKSMRAARILCKNRGSSLILAVILSFLALSFIQPIEGVQLNYNGEIIEIDSVTEEFDALTVQLENSQIIAKVLCGIFSILTVLMVAYLLIQPRLEDRVLTVELYYCHECKMTHPKKGLKMYFNGEFTNKCNSCMCGTTLNSEQTDSADYMIPIDHDITYHCYLPARYRAVKKIQKVSNCMFLILLILVVLATIAQADSGDCIKIKESKSISEPAECSAWLKLPTTCTGSTNLTEFFKTVKLPKMDALVINKLPGTMEAMFDESEHAATLFKSYLIEEGITKKYCSQLAKVNSGTGPLNVKAGVIIRSKSLELCSKTEAQNFCNCFTSTAGCSSSDDLNSVINHYKTHQEQFRSDTEKVISTLVELFPGLFAREVGLSLKAANFSKVKSIVDKMKNKFSQAFTIQACVNYLEKTLADSTLVNLNPRIELNKPIPSYSVNWKTQSIFENLAQATNTKICTSFVIYKCILPISARLEYYVTCNSETTKFYKVPDQGFAPKKGKETDLCVGDTFCELDFIAMTTAEKDELSSLICEKQDTTNFNFTKTRPIQKCRKVSSQVCSYKNQNKTFMECDNGFFYEYTNIFQANGDDIGVYCFDKNCKSFVEPHHVDNLAGCKLHSTNMKSKRLKEIVYENIEQLKHSVQEAIKNDLIEHKYILTKDLPKMSPTFRPLSILGFETDSGVENAYIETNLIVKAGVSTGITLMTKKGEKLFDIILFVKSAHYEAMTEYAYSTGPTIGINMQHDEQCTGQCPAKLMKSGWLSFSREHTSTWGCEEFGCLAINEGCVFGHCKDIIRPEMKVYKRLSDEIPKVSICAVLPDSSFCHDINSFNPIITDKIELQFLSNEAGRIPKIFGYKSNQVMTGMINDKGTFSKMCGSVQAIEKDVFGAGVPRFDYICHAARRKEITISKCYDNFYESCLSLETDKNMIFDDRTSKIQVLNKLMGEIRLKVKLGDIRYKVFEKDPSFDFKASCVGCINCIKGIDCELNILSSTDFVCPIESSCTSYYNNLKIESNTQKYGIKLKCTENPISITLCKQTIEVQASIVDKHETIEIGNSDQTYYVKEKDIRCNTWLCKVSEEGISSIFSPFISLFGSYGKIVFYSLLGLLLAFIAIYLLMPIFGRLRDLLKKNEIEYVRENFGYKPRRQ
ncbi:polyprotein [Guaratuba virus]|uniref:Envelopment polyprotein n=1 Tax=Guaratuba virus TaxID=2748208 RepID=A0A7D9MVY1_9VIRU|nr:polyprotein [Guaratuba virus]QLA47069.1 polyprotein [Guaratuba virus]